MAYIRRVVTTLRKTGPLCDDCLVVAADMPSRQQMALIAMDLVRAGRLLRKKMPCPQCGLTRRVSGIAKERPVRKKGLLARIFGSRDD